MTHTRTVRSLAAMPDRPETVYERDRVLRGIALGLVLGVVLAVAARRSR
jgi:hypothetical protein